MYFKNTLRFLLITLLSAIVWSLNAQDSVYIKPVPKLEYNLFYGKLLPHHQSMVEMSKKPYSGQELRLGFQTTGNEYWQQLFKYPTYGLGFYSGNFHNRTIGNPFALFGFMEFPFQRNADSWLSTSWSFGCTFNINEFDSITNPLNVAISTDLNVYIDLMVAYKYQFKNRLELGGGIKLQHFSNGAINYPNYGLNMLSIHATIGFITRNFKSDFKHVEHKPLHKRHEFYFFEGIGWCAKSLEESKTKYFNNTFSSVFNYRLNQKRTLGIGFDVFYNQENRKYFEGETMKSKNYFSYATLIGSDLLVNKFRVSVQVGMYLHKPVQNEMFFYERVALRYYLLPSVFTNISIKAYAFKAQYVEWGMGWAIN